MAENIEKKEINVEEIMEKIRREIKETGADRIPLSFNDKGNTPNVATSDSDGSRLGDAVSYLSYNYEVQPYQLLTGNPVKVFIKKVIRKTASFFFLPIVGQQNTLNFNFFLVAEAVREQKSEIEELKKTVEELKALASKSGEDRK